MGISQTVGQKSLNLTQDVKTVQTLLNRAMKTYIRFGQTQEKLTPDGICGSKTITAIGYFQSMVMRHKYPDKRIEPNKNTWKKLNENIPSKTQIRATASLQKSQLDNFLTWFKSDATSNVEKLADSFYKEVAKFLEVKSEVAGPKPVGLSKVTVEPFRQGDGKWGSIKLGNSSTGTIHSYGCAMVSLAMAATYLGSRTKHWPENLTPQKMTPIHANNILKKAGVFTANSYMLYITGGANALGMQAKDSGVGVKLGASARGNIDQCLSSGGLVLVHVDYKKSWVGDHWLLLTQKNSNGEYSGVDPAYGKALKLYKTPATGQTTSAHVVMYGRADSFGERTPENVKNYKVVRFVTLNAGTE
jgi:hypothetical protein